MDGPCPVHGDRAGTSHSIMDATPYRLVLIVRVRESIVQVQCKLCRIFSLYLQNLAHHCVYACDHQLSSIHVIVVRHSDRICSSVASRSDQSEVGPILDNLRGAQPNESIMRDAVVVTFPIWLLFENEKERERGSNLQRQRRASSTAQVLVAQTTRPVQKNQLRDEL